MKTFNRFNGVILIDLNWLGMKSTFRFADFAVNTSSGRILTGSLFGCLQAIESICTNYPFCKIIICNDGIDATKSRVKLFEGYKSSRRDPSKPPKPEVAAWRNLKPELFRMLGGIPNLTALQADGYEADDLIAKLAYLSAESGKDVLIFSSDKDMQQLTAEPRICTSKEISDGELVVLQEDYVLNHKDIGVMPEYIPYMRSWVGDPSDDIPSAAPRVSRVLLKRIAEGWKNLNSELTETSLSSILEGIQDINVTKVTREKLINGISQANLNYQLMDLTRYKSESIESVKIIPLEYNRDTILFYQLKKYLSWREGNSLTAIDVDALLEKAYSN